MRPSVTIRFAALAAALACGASQTSHAAEPAEYRGTCDASAAAALDGAHFVIGNDEDNVLRTYRLGQAAPVASLDLDQFGALKTRDTELDIEGTARIGNRIYWITSHGTNRKGSFRQVRHRLFATDIVPDPTGGAPRLVAVGKPNDRLIDDLAEIPALAKYRLDDAATRPPGTTDGLNIEGLTASPDGTLLIGFRGPLAQAKALVIEIADPDAAAVEGLPVKAARAMELDLGGLAIRGMAHIPGGYMIAAGTTADGGEFKLFRWSGRDTDRPTPVATPPWPKRWQPEALLALPDGGLYVVSDDGDRPIDGRMCKELPTQDQRFRILPIAP